MEIKHMNMSLKATELDDRLGTGTAYLAVFNVVDGQKDVILPGAFSKTIREAETRRKLNDIRYLIPILWQHEHDKPIGAITSMKEDTHGLLIDFELDMTSELGKRAYSALRMGYVTGFSIGYRAIKDRMRPDGIRELLEVELHEGSIVTFPANEQARVLADSLKRDVSIEDAALGLVATMKDIIRRCEPSNKAERGQRSNTMRDDYYGRPPLPSPGNPLVDESEPSYIVEYGVHPEESRANFERELRAGLRSEDPELYELVPGGKQQKKLIAQRQKERVAKQKAQQEALETERREIAAKQAAMSKEAYTPEQWSAATGYDLAWVRGWFAKWANSGQITPLDVNKLVLSRSDIGKMARRDYEQIEFQALKATHRREQGR